VNPKGKSIVLVGMMGAGKSTVGSCLQRRTNFPLFDIDGIVASKFEIPISEIFSTYGETRFREAETSVLREISRAKQAIIVTGGGIVLRRENVEILKQLGVVVWLDGDEGTLFKRAMKSGNRPLLRGKNPRQAFAQMLKQRLPVYARTADLRINTSALTDEEVALAILTKLKQSSRSRGPGAPIQATAS
jgi:shikimate kinase